MRAIRWVALLAFAGCGGGGTSYPTSVPPTPATGTVHVGGSSNSFSPQTLNINVGDTVSWTWDGGPHTVTSGAPGAVDGRFCSLPGGSAVNASTCNSTGYAVGAGSTYTHTFTTGGSYPYFCEVHGAMMSGTIVVGAGGGGGGGGGGGTGGGGGSY